jgi:hypothetical protein
MSKESGPRGARGIPGPPGRIGKSGPAGKKGKTGARGPKGAMGARENLGAPSAGGAMNREALSRIHEQIQDIYQELDVQLRRMAQLQMQLDEVRAKVERLIAV